MIHSSSLHSPDFYLDIHTRLLLELSFATVVPLYLKGIGFKLAEDELDISFTTLLSKQQ